MSPTAVTWRRFRQDAFLGRLHWHCHFIQKLESEPELEWRKVHRGYDGLREPDWNPAFTGARCKRPQAPPASTPPGFTTRSSKRMTLTPRGCLCAAGPAGVTGAWPVPLVGLAAATRIAKDRQHSLRRTPAMRAGKAAIVEKDASRKMQGKRARGARRSHQASPAANAQLSLGFD